MARTAKVAHVAKSSSKSLPGLPSLSDLLTDSWDRLKEIGGRVLGLYLLMIASVIGIVFVGLVLGGIAALGGALFSDIESVLRNPSAWISMGAIFLLSILIAGFVSSAFSASIILAIDEGNKKQQFGALLRRGFPLLIPIFVVGLLTQLLVVGGLFLAIIPGIVIAIFLSFTAYEVILGNARGLTALKNSASIVQQNFWGVLGRWAVLIGVQMVVSIVLGSLSDMDNALAPLFSLMSSLFSVFFSLYTLVYGVLLYRAARANTNLQKQSLVWMVVVSAVGWVIGVILMGVALTGALGLAHYARENPDAVNEFMQKLETRDGDSFGQSGDDSQLQNGEYEQFVQELSTDGKWSEQEMDQLYQQVVELEQQPVQ